MVSLLGWELNMLVSTGYGHAPRAQQRGGEALDPFIVLRNVEPE